MLRTMFTVTIFILATLSADGNAATCLNGSCHKALTTTKFLHGPVAAEQAGGKGCIACHVPAGKSCSPGRKGVFKPLQSSTRMCQVCHSRGAGTQHSVKRIDCLKCHDPHGSNKNMELNR